MKKGLASQVLRHPHFAHSKRVARWSPISKAAYDQYATMPQKCHVVHNMVFSQKARKPPGQEARLCSSEVIDSKWWPGTGLNRRRRPFQGRLARQLSGLESADIIETISLVASSI